MLGQQYNLLSTAFALLIDDMGANDELWSMLSKLGFVPSRKSISSLKLDASNACDVAIKTLQSAGVPFKLTVDNIDKQFRVDGNRKQGVHAQLCAFVPLPSYQFDVADGSLMNNVDVGCRDLLPISNQAMLLRLKFAAEYVAKCLGRQASVKRSLFVLGGDVRFVLMHVLIVVFARLARRAATRGIELCLVAVVAISTGQYVLCYSIDVNN